MRIAILEDDPSQLALYDLWLSTAQHTFVQHTTVSTFLAELHAARFDLLMIDMGLPDGSGAEVLAWIRTNLGWDIPVIVVTAEEAESAVVSMLRAGADDYVVKPPKYFELIARIEALGRRTRASAAQALRLGAYEIHYADREIRLHGKPVELNQKEFQVACHLFEHPGRLLSRVSMLEALWGLQAEIDTRTVDTHVSRLRRKLNIYPENGWQIISVYGYGYRLEPVSLETGSGGGL